ncbi:MAG: undecaprenyl-diphosphate phosphatase [Pseudomonadota bacterium]
MEVFQAVILGIIQGIAEFLPISSSGHLILVPKFTGWQDQGIGFDLSVHIGTLFAILIYFRKDVSTLAVDGLKSIHQRKTVGQSQLFWAVLLGTIPACIVGALILDLIEQSLRSEKVIFFTTIIFGILLGLADRKGNTGRDLETVTWKEGILIGCAQAVALIPGTSRSGITMTTGLFLGLNRKAASRFSFFLAIPITGLAATAKLIEIATSNESVEWGIFLLGAIVSFVVGLATIHYFLKWLNAFGMLPYVIYRLLLGLVIYVVFLS